MKNKHSNILFCVGLALMLVLTGCISGAKDKKEENAEVRLKNLKDIKNKAIEVDLTFEEEEYDNKLQLDMIYYPKEEKAYAKKSNVQLTIDNTKQVIYTDDEGVTTSKTKDDMADTLLLSSLSELGISKKELKKGKGSLTFSDNDKDLDELSDALEDGFANSGDDIDIEEVKIEYSKDYYVSEIEVNYTKDDNSYTYIEEYTYGISASKFKKEYKQEQKELSDLKKDILKETEQTFDEISERELKGQAIYKGPDYDIEYKKIDITKLPYTASPLTKEDIEKEIFKPMKKYALDGVWNPYSRSEENKEEMADMNEITDFVETKIKEIDETRKITVEKKGDTYYMVISFYTKDYNRATYIYKFE